MRLLAFFLLIASSVWAADNDLDLTPNLEPKNNFWTKSSPIQQLAFSVTDVVAFGALDRLQDPEYREAELKVKRERKGLEKIQNRLKAAKDNFNRAEQELQRMTTEREALKGTAAGQLENIKAEELKLEKTKSIVTSSERLAELSKVKEQIRVHHHEAFNKLQGVFESLDDLHSNLSSTEQAELKSLMARHNELIRMPDVTGEQKEELVRQAEAAVKRAIKARDSTLDAVNLITNQITAQRETVERLRPDRATIEGELTVQRGLVGVAEQEREAAAKGKRIKIFRYKTIQVIGKTYVVLDLGFRIIYLYVSGEDPGWFPVFRVLRFFG